MTRPLRPLAGVRVLDLSRNLPGPFLTSILAGLGAQVIKVEPPRGEGMRWMPPRRDGMGVAYASVNAGKRSLALDAKRPEGQAVLRALVREVDVLVETHRPGVLDRLGLDDATLEALNPRLVVCSITGYGQTGPLAPRAGHDLNYLARSGVLSLFGPRDRPPQVPAVQIADVGGGSLPAAIGVLAALMERDQTGRGRKLDVSMTRGAIAFAGMAVATRDAGYREPRGDGMLTGGAPCYRCYETSDGRYLALGALEPHFFALFCQTIGLPDLAASGYATGEAGEAVAGQIAQVIAGRTMDEWTAALDGLDVCCEPVLTLEEARAQPGVGDPIVEVGGFLGVSPDVGAGSPAPDAPPAALGVDGRAVCEALGVDPALVDAAVAAGAMTV